MHVTHRWPLTYFAEYILKAKNTDKGTITNQCIRSILLIQFHLNGISIFA